MYDYDEYEQWLRTATNGQMLREILRNQWSMMEAQDLEIKLEFEQMIDIKRMAAEATKNSDAFSAFKKAMDDTLAALRATMGDPAEFEAAMAMFEANTAAMAAAAVANTPVAVPPVPVVETPPAGGQSTGGANPSVD